MCSPVATRHPTQETFEIFNLLLAVQVCDHAVGMAYRLGHAVPSRSARLSGALFLPVAHEAQKRANVVINNVWVMAFFRGLHGEFIE